MALPPTILALGGWWNYHSNRIGNIYYRSATFIIPSTLAKRLVLFVRLGWLEAHLECWWYEPRVTSFVLQSMYSVSLYNISFVEYFICKSQAETIDHGAVLAPKRIPLNLPWIQILCPSCQVLSRTFMLHQTSVSGCLAILTGILFDANECVVPLHWTMFPCGLNIASSPLPHHLHTLSSSHPSLCLRLCLF